MEKAVWETWSEADYEVALGEVSDLIDRHPPRTTAEGDRLEFLVSLVIAYERIHYPIGLPSPIGAIEGHLDRMGLDHNALIPVLGSAEAVDGVMERRNRLSPVQVQALHRSLGIPLDILNQEYILAE